jgi:hypothetical protein
MVLAFSENMTLNRVRAVSLNHRPDTCLRDIACHPTACQRPARTSRW